MKKISVVLLSTVVLFLASCAKDANESPEPPLAENVPVTSVVPSTAAQNAEPITEQIFEEKAKAVIEADIKKIVASLPLDKLNFLSTSSISNSANTSRAVTINQLQTSFSEIKDSFITTTAEDGTAGSITGSWNGPVGEIDFGDDEVAGLTAAINALNLNLDAVYSVSETGMSFTANGGAKVSFTAGLDFTDITEEETSIKTAKLNAGYTAAASKVNATADFEAMEADVTDASVSTGAYETMLGAVKTISGNISYEALIDSAAYFEIPSDGVIYNGVLKTNSNASLNLELSKKSLDELTELLTSTMTPGKQFTSADFAILEKYITLKFNVDVYDAAGNYLFTYMTIESLTDLFDYVQTEMTPVVE